MPHISIHLYPFLIFFIQGMQNQPTRAWLAGEGERAWSEVVSLGWLTLVTRFGNAKAWKKSNGSKMACYLHVTHVYHCWFFMILNLSRSFENNSNNPRKVEVGVWNFEAFLQNTCHHMESISCLYWSISTTFPPAWRMLSEKDPREPGLAEKTATQFGLYMSCSWCAAVIAVFCGFGSIWSLIFHWDVL